MAGRGRPKKNPEQPAAPKKKKKESAVIEQSNYFTMARYNYTAVEKRILYRVFEQACYWRRANIKWFEEHGEGQYRADRHVEFTMPMKNFMSPKAKEDSSGKDYNEIYEGFKSLNDKKIQFKWKGGFTIGAIVNRADWNEKEGTITFEIHKWVWQAAVDYTHGHTKALDIVIAMSFTSPYTMRFFELLKSFYKEGCFIYSLEELREMFGCQDKYPDTYEFKRRVIEPAKKELDESSPLTFVYDRNPERGKVIKGFKFTIIKQVKNMDQDTMVEEHPFEAYLPEVKMWLKNKLGFKEKQLRGNAKTFYEFQQLFPNGALDELEETYQYIHRQGYSPSGNVGWFIQNIKAKIDNAKAEQPANPEGAKRLEGITKGLALKYRK